MKIIFVTSHLDEFFGGTRFVPKVLSLLATKFNGFETYIIAGRISKSRVLEEGTQKGNFHIINLNIFSEEKLPHQQITKSLAFLASAKKIVMRLTDHVTVLHTDVHIPNYLCHSSPMRIPIIRTIHHLEIFHSFSSLKVKLMLPIAQDLLEVNSRCHVLHVPSNHVKNQIQRKSMVNKDKVVVIPPGIELKQYLNVKRKIEDDVFLMIGRLVRRKHYDHAVLAFKIVRRHNKNAKLIIIGDGPERPRLQSLISKHDLSNNIMILGGVSEKKKIELLSKAKAVIHLGYPEGFGIPIVEAHAVGVPVIAYNVPPLNEVIEHGVTGLLVERDNILDFAQQVLTIDTYDFDENTMRGNAMRYDIEKIALRFYALYKKILNHSLRC